MSKLTILIGAGFSASVGMPLGKDIQARFDRDQREKLLLVSSSEWFWIDGKDDIFIHNGSINSQNIYYSYILNELVVFYKQEKGGFIDYEDFFQYLILKFEQNDGWLNHVYSIAKKSLFHDYPNWNTPEALEYNSYLNDEPSVYRLISLINHLIADILSIKITEDQLIKSYKGFVNYIMNFDEVAIFTLNHDLILESTLNLFGINFCRGFSVEDSTVFFEDKQLPVFNNNFENEKIKIYKLHGSLDYYRYPKIDSSFNYFTTTNYRTKHYAETRNPETNDVIYEFNTDIVPKFITGKDKPQIIKNDFMYSKLFEHFEKEIASTENLLVSGYSFGDEHINNELIKRNDINIINQNPFNKYPFGGSIKDINEFIEL
jgi:hypothetical protein